MKKATWIRRSHLLRKDEYICSACKKTVDKPVSVCPFCGTRMGKTKYDAGWVDEAEAMSALLDEDW